MDVADIVITMAKARGKIVDPEAVNMLTARMDPSTAIAIWNLIGTDMDTKTVASTMMKDHLTPSEADMVRWLEDQVYASSLEVRNTFELGKSRASTMVANVAAKGTIVHVFTWYLGGSGGRRKYYVLAGRQTTEAEIAAFCEKLGRGRYKLGNNGVAPGKDATTTQPVV